MAVDISRTRTSRRWTSRPPGNLDRLNLRAVYPGIGPWEFPSIKATSTIPDELVAWGSGQSVRQGLGALHFFLDDYRFETLWNRPEWGVGKVKAMTDATWTEGVTGVTGLGCSLGVDFSVWADMPRVMQAWNVYRSRWLTAYWQDHGIDVIPTVSWSDTASYEWCFDGLPRHSTVAVGTVGVSRTSAGQAAFLAGYRAMREAIEPTTILVYGRILDDMKGDAGIIAHKSRWESRRGR